MAQTLGKEFLGSLLSHEIKELSRIKSQLNLAERIPAIDNIALAVVPTEGRPDRDVIEPIKSALRDSDVIFPGEGYLVLLLPGTDEMGAIHILEGVSDFLGEGLKFTYVIYPDDGETTEDLLNRLREKALRELGLKVS